MSLFGMILALAAVLAGPPAPKPEAETAPHFAGTHVLVRTADDLLTGHDLRYQDGEFRLRGENGDTALAESTVKQIQFFDLPHDELKDPLIRLAGHVAYLRRAPILKRFLLVQRFREGLFLRPEEPLAQAFRRLVPKMWHPDLAAVLCTEAAHRCLVERRPKDAPALFEAAEAAEKQRPGHAFVYALMRVAAMNEAARPDEAQEALRRLQQAYPDRWREIARFRIILQDDPDRPFPPRPLKGLRPERPAP